jgi:hypothetical protein
MTASLFTNSNGFFTNFIVQFLPPGFNIPPTLPGAMPITPEPSNPHPRVVTTGRQPFPPERDPSRQQPDLTTAERQPFP